MARLRPFQFAPINSSYGFRLFCARSHWINRGALIGSDVWSIVCWCAQYVFCHQLLGLSGRVSDFNQALFRVERLDVLSFIIFFAIRILTVI